MSGEITKEVVTKAVRLWLPVFGLLLPGIVIAIAFEVVIAKTIQHIEITTLQLHHFTSDQIRSMTLELEQKEYSWWWPPDWLSEQLDRNKLDLLRTTTRHVALVGILQHLFFAGVYTVLHCVQLVSLALITLIVIRSFTHVLFRVWLRDGGQLEFALAPGRNQSQCKEAG